MGMWWEMGWGIRVCGMNGYVVGDGVGDNYASMWACASEVYGSVFVGVSVYTAQ